MLLRAIVLLPLLLLASLAVGEPNNTATHVAEVPSINISFIKEVTLTVAPQDLALTPHQEQEVSSFLESGLRLLDPIMRFFEGLAGWQHDPPHPHA
jgi:hypothetical protein